MDFYINLQKDIFRTITIILFLSLEVLLKLLGIVLQYRLYAALVLKNDNFHY